jgi:hypothetical protein
LSVVGRNLLLLRMLDYLSAIVFIAIEEKRERKGLTLRYRLSFDGMNQYDLYLKVMRRSGRMVGLLCSR